THLAIALFLAWIFRLDKFAAALGTLANNPLSALPIYLGGWRIGCYLLSKNPRTWKPHEFNSQEMLRFIESFSHGILFPLMTGLGVVALGTGIVVYFLARYGVEWTRTQAGVVRRPASAKRDVCPPNTREKS